MEYTKEKLWVIDLLLWFTDCLFLFLLPLANIDVLPNFNSNKSDSIVKQDESMSLYCRVFNTRPSVTDAVHTRAPGRVQYINISDEVLLSSLVCSVWLITVAPYRPCLMSNRNTLCVNKYQPFVFLIHFTFMLL